MELAIMIEGQDGLTWERWTRIAEAVEELGFAGLYRSDHYTNAEPPDKESLECWVSLTWLASHTQRIEFGPLVSPLSFREPTMLARMAAAVDDLSGGRLTLGAGAGWQEREHANYGWELLDIPERFDRFEEGLEVLARLLYNDSPSDFAGSYFQLREGILLPRPARRLPLLIGGNGEKRTLPLAARYADEWNGVYLTPEGFEKRNRRLTELLQTEGRNPASVRRSLMTGLHFDKDGDALRRQLRETGRDESAMRRRGVLVGGVDEIVEQIGELAEVDVQRVMLQWLEQDNIDGLGALAQLVMPQVR